MKKKNNYSSKFKFEVVMGALFEQKTLQQIANKYLNLKELYKWDKESYKLL